MKIENYVIDNESPVFIIAEAGVNHNGELNFAKQLVDAAVIAKANAVKFQTFKTENLNTKQAPKSSYHLKNTPNDDKESWYDLLKSEELTKAMHIELIDYCKKKEIIFLSTPYDYESADLLEEFNMPAYKIASTDANNFPFLKYVAQKQKPVILSTAMCTIDEVRKAVDSILSSGNNDLALLHCTANYPCAIENSNLRMMQTLAKEFNLLVGYSDHSLENINPIAAVSMGAKIIEKHFTVSRGLPGPDHQASLLPEELKQTIAEIRLTEKALGNPEKEPQICEKENRLKLRKSVVAKKNIKKDTEITLSHLIAKRPGTGIPPSEIDNIVGKKAKVDVQKDHLITWAEVG